ncbi:hypothetical protein [Curvibacter gracilis]|uniref:hypothetical protein n=1 Tax=Curvibacter gracilis TaxID=230310 RepID=UPI0004856F17|nr:hypothetical protein [Curvibacter gracilis]
MSKLHPRLALQWVLLLALGVLAVAALQQLWPAAIADLGTAKTRAALVAWQAHPKPVPLKQWGAWRDDVAKGLAQTPGDAQLQAHMGYLYANFAEQAQGVPGLAQGYYQQAYSNFSRAATLRPMAPEFALNAGLAASLSGDAALKLRADAWLCRSIRYTAKGVPFSPIQQAVPPGACPS